MDLNSVISCGRMVSGSVKEGSFREQGPLFKNGINRNLFYYTERGGLILSLK